jgi:hypothetical protein
MPLKKVQQANASGPRRVKLPRHMRLPKMEDWQFFDTARLSELHNLEEKAYATMKANKELPHVGLGGKLQVLSDELQEEKERLLHEGKADWTRSHFSSFVKVSMCAAAVVVVVVVVVVKCCCPHVNESKCLHDINISKYLISTC